MWYRCYFLMYGNGCYIEVFYFWKSKLEHHASKIINDKLLKQLTI